MTRSMMFGCAAAALAAAALAGCNQSPDQSAQAPASASDASAANVQPTLTPGVVTQASDDSITITSQGAPITYRMRPDTNIMVTHKGSLADIKAGDFLGTTNVPSADGTGTSTEVHIFPPGVRMGEGDRPMGPPPAGGGGTQRMTNGTVSAAGPAGGGQRMTNGAAGNVSSGGQGVQMDVAYQGGKRHVVVPASTPVMVMSSGKPDMLKPGTNVLVGHVKGQKGDEATFINVQ